MTHTPRALRMAGLHRLLRGRGHRGQMVAKPAAFCECSPADGDLPVTPDGLCASCHRPVRDASPFGLPPIESGYPLRGRDW